MCLEQELIHKTCANKHMLYVGTIIANCADLFINNNFCNCLKVEVIYQEKKAKYSLVPAS